MIKPLEEQKLGTQFCSYRVGGPLDEAYLPTTLEEAVAVLTMVRDTGKPLTVIGGGCNSMIASQGIRGVTFIGKRLMFTEQLGDCTFRFGAGMTLSRICTLTQEHGLTGGEFFIGVPGTVGGAVTMNAGATGQETAAVVDHVVVFNRETAEIETWNREHLDFSYRKSSIDPDKVVVLAAQMTFQPGDPKAIAELVQKNLTFRQQHHPKEPNGGSVFKNPAPGMPAGRLLDEAGAKGWREGGAMVSPVHANFIVNMGNATSTDILRLMCRMKQTIKEQYGLDAHPENRFLGDATDEEITMWEELTGRAWND